MEKISRIVPANRHITNDWKESTQSGGTSRATGRNFLHSSKDLALQAHRELRGWRAKEARHNDIAEKIQTGFFPSPKDASEPVSEAPQFYTEDFLKGQNLSSVDAFSSPELDPFSSHEADIDSYIADVMAEAEAFKNQSASPSDTEEEWASYPKGSFINVEA